MPKSGYKEEYELVQFTKYDKFWYNFYEPLQEFLSITVEAMCFFWHDSIHSYTLW